MASLFDQNEFPALSRLMSQPAGNPAPVQPRSNWFTAGLSAGVDQLQGFGGAALGAAGQITNIDSLRDYGTDVYKRNMAQISEQTGRPDLEGLPDSLSKAPAWVGYQFLKNAPTMIAAIAATRAGGAKLAGMVPEKAVELGARAPTWLGGGGLRAGMAAEEVATARAAGARLAGDIAAAAPVNYPLAVGSLYGEAIDRGDPGKGDAALAFLGGVPYSALESLAPAKLEKFMAKGAEGGLVKRVTTQALGTAPVEAITEGVQTAMEQSFRPDLSFNEKASNIVTAMVTGGVVGGVAGGLTGIRKMKTADAAATSNDSLKQTVDEVLTGFDESGRLRSEFQKNPSSNYTQQPTLDGIAPPVEGTVSGASDQELQQRLAEIRQRDLIDAQRQGSAFNSAFLPPEATERANQPADLTVKDAIINELGQRQQAAPVSEAVQPGFDLFDSDLFDPTNIPLATQYAPQADEAPMEKELTEVQKTKAAFLGESKAKWAQDIINDPASSTVDLYAGVIRAINSYDEKPNAPLPQKLLALGEKIGLFNAEGQPRNLKAEYAAAAKKNDANWAKVKLTQTGAKEAAAYQNNTLKPLEAAKALLEQAQAKVEEQSRPSPVARPAQEAPPPVQKAVQSAAVMNSSKNQLRLELRTNNPAVERGDAAWLQRQQQQAEAKPDGKAVTGSMTAWTANAVDLPLKVIGKLPGVAQPSETDQTKVSRLSKLVERNGWKPQPITIVVNHRGEAYVANGKARLAVARQTKQKTIPVQIEWMNGAELTNSSWAPASLISTLTGQPVEQMPLTPDPYAASVSNPRVTRVAPAPRTQQTQAAPVETVAAPAPVSGPVIEAAPVAAPVVESTSVPAPVEAVAAPAPAPVVQPSAAAASIDTQTAPVTEPAPKRSNPKTLKEAVQAYNNGVDLAKWIMRNTRDDVYKALLRKILPSLENTLVRVVNEGDKLPRVAANALFDANGIYFSMESGERALFIWADRITENTLVHELLHAATNTRLKYGNRTDQTNTQLGRIVDEFMKLRDAVLDYYKKNSDPNVAPDARLEAAVTDVREMATYTFTDPKIREFFKSVPYAGANAFTKFVELVRKLFNIPASQQSAFTRLIDLTEQLVDQPNPVATRPLDMNSLSGGGGTVTPQLPGKLEEINNSAKNVMGTVKNIEQGLSNLRKTSTWRDWSLKFNAWHLKVSTTQQIAEYFGAPFKRADGSNILLDWVKKQRERSVIQQRLAHLVRAGYLEFESVRKASAKAAQYINDLMQYSALEIDPRKTWAEHTWLHGSKNEAALIKLVAAANQTRRTLKQVSPNGYAAYENFIATNEAHHYIQQALSLYNLLQREGMVPEEVKQKLKNPMTAFLADSTVYDSAPGARDYWKKATDDLVKVATDLVQSQTGQDITDPKMADAVNKSANTIKARVSDIVAEQEAMKQAPYFHIGRFGDNVLKFNIRKLDGKADPAALERIAKTLDDMGIKDVLIPEVSNRANAFIRFENIATRDEVMRAMQQLEKQGLVSDIEAFRRSDEISQEELSYQLPESVQKLMDSIKGNYLGESLNLDEEGQKLLKKLNRELQNHITQHFMNQLPDTAISKVMVHRNYVPGASKDFVRAYAFRTEIASRAIASLATAPDMSNLSGEMQGVANDLRRSTDTQAATMAQQTVNELQIREAERPVTIKNTFVDYLRAFVHTMFLGLSPGYFATQLTSVSTTLWPELSKRYGYVPSAKAIARVTPTAMKVIGSVIAEGKKGGFKNLADATITRKGLENAGITGATAEFIIRIVNTGAIDIGTQTREMGRIAEGVENSKFELAMRWGSAVGYYSEMFTRILAALSARELHGGNGNEMFDYALSTVQQSMFIFDADNTARAVGRNGVLGGATPIVTQFQQYMYQVTEKLMREFHTAFRDSAKTPAEKAEARRFLGAHLMGMTVVSGVLGWPMASIAAKILDKAVDLFGDDDDEPFNSQIALRNWLNYTFGDGVGNVIARGVPRAFNFDISKRVGEQDMLPQLQLFSKLLTDRRNYEESFKEWLSSSSGSALGLMGNMLQAADRLNEGDLMGAAIEAAPAALRGPLQTIKLYNNGYEDSKGNRQPIQPSTSDYIWQSLGLTPAQRADYSEQNAAQASMRVDMRTKASNIRTKLLNAIEDGDMEKAQELVDRARAFDEKNPSRKILDDVKSELKARKRERDLAERLGAGLGVKEEDVPYTSFFKPQ